MGRAATSLRRLANLMVPLNDLPLGRGDPDARAVLIELLEKDQSERQRKNDAVNAKRDKRVGPYIREQKLDAEDGYDKRR